MVTRQIIVIIEDQEPSSTEHYLKLLEEELRELLGQKQLKLVEVRDKQNE